MDNPISQIWDSCFSVLIMAAIKREQIVTSWFYFGLTFCEISIFKAFMLQAITRSTMSLKQFEVHLSEKTEDLSKLYYALVETILEEAWVKASTTIKGQRL